MVAIALAACGEVAQLPIAADVGSHRAALGLAFSKSAAWPAPSDNGIFIGLHGSWNRKPRSSYRVIFVPFKADKPFGDPIDVLTGFVNADGDNAFGDPWASRSTSKRRCWSPMM
jgi:glucose/arabinose dehydrogenase